MKIIAGFLVHLWLLLDRILAASVDQIPLWNLNPNDQIAVSLYKLFNVKKHDTIEYTHNGNVTRITSNDYFAIKEFQPGCKSLNLGYASGDGSANCFTALCNKGTEFYEMNVDQNGKIVIPVDNQPIFKAEPGLFCLDTVWSKTHQVYALICHKPEETVAGFFYVYIVNRSTRTAIGFSKIDGATLSGAKFSAKPKIREYTVEKGALKTAEVFIAYNEPHPDGTEIIVEERNRWFLLIDVDPTTKKPEPIKFVSFAGVPFLGQSKKMLSMEIINKNLYIWHFSSGEQIQFIKCTGISYPKPTEGTLTGCTSLPHKLTMRFGAIDVHAPNFVSFFNKPEKKLQFCLFDEGISVDVLKDCREFKLRDDPDLEFDMFDECSTSGCTLYFLNEKKSFNIGIDKLTFNPTNLTDIKLDRFKTIASACREFRGKYYSSIDSFIEVYDNLRTEEIVVEARLIQPDKPYVFDMIRTHEGKKDVKALNTFRNARTMHTIRRTPYFPKMIGYLGKDFRVPLGRAYFVGNRIDFQLKLPTDIQGHIQNVNDLFVMNFDANLEKRMDNVKTFFHSYGYQTILLKSRTLQVLRCYKRVAKEVFLRCQTITSFPNAINSDQEDIIGTYETQQNLIIVTNKAGIMVYDKINKNDVKFFEGVPGGADLISVSFKVKDSVVMLAAVQKSPKTILLYEVSLYDSTTFRAAGTISSYQAGPAQESGGEFCPTSVRFGVEDDAILNIVNSCPTRDRRIIRYNLVNYKAPLFVSNQFIRVPEFKQENLLICSDTEVFIMAAPGTNKAIGIGYDSPNLIEDLAMDELEVKEIKTMVCLTDKAFGILYVDKSNRLCLATYFIGRMAFGNNRLHSVIYFEGLGDYVRLTGSEGNGMVVYNFVGSKEPDKVYLKSVLLDGPDTYLKSDKKMIANDLMILSSNFQSNESFDMKLEFHPQKFTTTFGNKVTKFKIEAKDYVLDDINLTDGPVYDYKIVPSSDGFNCASIFTLENRLTNTKEFIEPLKSSENKWLFASKLTKDKAAVFALLQKTDSSLIHVNDPSSKIPPFEVTLTERCQNLEVIAGEKYVAFLSCSMKSEARFVIYEFDKNTGEIVRKRYSDIRARSTAISVSLTSTRYGYVLASIDQNKVMQAWSFDIENDSGNGGMIVFKPVYTINNVILVRLVRTEARINMLYFHPYDTMAQLKLINLSTLETTGATRQIVTTSDDTNMASFECLRIDTGEIACIFTTFGPNSYRITFREDLSNGLIENEKSSFQMHNDNYPIKTKFNKNYFAILTFSPSRGAPRLLVYRSVPNGERGYLWAALNYELIPSDRPVEDIDFLLTQDNQLLVLTNNKEKTDLSMIKQYAINDAKIKVLKPDINELKKCRIQVNTGLSDIAPSFIPASHIFLHRSEQAESNFMNSSKWWHWVLLILFFGAVIGVIYYFYRREVVRRQKLKEDSLCHNLGDKVNF
jgi:hypothetical protein